MDIFGQIIAIHLRMHRFIVGPIFSHLKERNGETALYMCVCVALVASHLCRLRSPPPILPMAAFEPIANSLNH